MEAKDTVMSNEQMSKFIQYPVEGYTSDRLELCQAQAEISFRAGMQEVAEWIHRNGYFSLDTPDDWDSQTMWQAKLKEWGIK